MAKKWIAGAIKHPGALHKELGVPQGKKIPKSKLAKAAHAGGKLGQRARLAETLGHMHGGKDVISKDSMKGKALLEGRRDNLASKKEFCGDCE